LTDSHVSGEDIGDVGDGGDVGDVVNFGDLEGIVGMLIDELNLAENSLEVMALLLVAIEL